MFILISKQILMHLVRYVCFEILTQTLQKTRGVKIVSLNFSLWISQEYSRLGTEGEQGQSPQSQEHEM